MTENIGICIIVAYIVTHPSYTPPVSLELNMSTPDWETNCKHPVHVIMFAGVAVVNYRLTVFCVDLYW